MLCDEKTGMEAALHTAFVLDYPASGIDKQVRQTVSKIGR